MKDYRTKSSPAVKLTLCKYDFIIKSFTTHLAANHNIHPKTTILGPTDEPCAWGVVSSYKRGI